MSEFFATVFVGSLSICFEERTPSQKSLQLIIPGKDNSSETEKSKQKIQISFSAGTENSFEADDGRGESKKYIIFQEKTDGGSEAENDKEKAPGVTNALLIPESSAFSLSLPASSSLLSFLLSAKEKRTRVKIRIETEASKKETFKLLSCEFQ